jgi:hypothetical protein
MQPGATAQTGERAAIAARTRIFGQRSKKGRPCEHRGVSHICRRTTFRKRRPALIGTIELAIPGTCATGGRETEQCVTAAQFQFSATHGSLDHVLAARCVDG